MRHLTLIVTLAIAGVLAAGAASFAEGDKPAPANDKLPKAVADAVKAQFPNLTVVNVKLRDDKVYIVRLAGADKNSASTMRVTETGTVLFISNPVDAKDLPKAVTDAVNKVAPEATVASATRSEQRFDWKKGKLDKPVVGYELTLTRGDMKARMLVGEDGTGASAPEFKKEEKKDKEKKDK